MHCFEHQYKFVLCWLCALSVESCAGVFIIEGAAAKKAAEGLDMSPSHPNSIRLGSSRP